MRIAHFIPALAVFLLSACSTGVPSTRIEQNRRLSGTWSCVSATVDGKPLPEDTVKLLRLTLAGNKYQTRKGDDVLFDSSYTVDPSTNPKRINILGTEGALAGKEALGSYLLKGDTLRICYILTGETRPTAFESPIGSGAYLLLWKRVGQPAVSHADRN
jgi:uncharacterized protein (TIGR03067 family)